MIRIVYMLLTGAILLFGYQKGDSLSMEMNQKLGIEKEKIYVIDFFASWCASCKREMPDLSRFSESQITKDKGIEVIGIDVDQDSQKAKTFQSEMRKENALTFRVINDPKGEIIKHFNPIGMPALYVIKDAKVLEVILGAKDNIDNILQKTIKEHP